MIFSRRENLICARRDTRRRQGILPRRHSSHALLHVAVLLVLTITLAHLLVSVHAGSTSDLTVDSIWLEDASQPGQPVSQILPGQSFLIVATIKNIGQETAPGYYVDVYYDSDYGRGGPDSISTGEAQIWYVGPLTAQDGTHITKWVVDPDNLIAELNESNNQKDYTFTVGQQTATTTTVQTTQVLTSTGTTAVTGYTTTTLTSYVGTQTSTSTIVVPTTVTVGPSTSTSTVQTTQVLTSAGTATVTGYTTTTVTSYTGTQTSTSTIVVPTTVTVGGSAATLAVQSTPVLAATVTTTVIAYTTTTLTSYTATTTSTSTNTVYTTVTKLGTAAAGASSPLTYIGFLSLLGVTAGRRVKTRKSWRIPKVHDHEWKDRARRVEEDQKSCFQGTFLTSGGVANHGACPRCSCGRFPRQDFPAVLPSGWG